MKVLLLIAEHYDNSTSTVVMGGLGQAYRSRGLDVTVAGLKTPSSNNSDKPDFEMTASGPLWRLGGARPGSRRRLGTLRRQLQQIVPGVDFIHLHFWGRYTHALWTAWTASQRLGVPMGVTFQDYGAPFLPPHPRWQKARLEQILSRCAWVTALSRYSARKLAQDFPSLSRRVRVVPDGFDPARAAGARSAPRRRPFILCVARLLPYKGVDLLLMAWRDVCETEKGVDLVLCGKDHEKVRGHYQRLARLLGISARVQFVGQVGHARVFNLMRSCLFSVLPSRHESFGMAALEAMACGKAVLTVAQGPGDFVEEGVSGMLFPPMKDAPLRDGLLKLLRESRLRRRLGAGARKAAGRFTWDNAAEAYLRLPYLARKEAIRKPAKARA